MACAQHVYTAYGKCRECGDLQCPVCEGACELEEVRAEIAEPPLKLVSVAARLEHQERLFGILRRLEREHA